MGPVWVVLADSHRARIYEQAGRGAPLALVDELTRPSAQLRAGELLSDSWGQRSEAHLGGHGGAPGFSAVKGTAVPASDPAAIERERFAKEVAERIQRGRVEGAFVELALFMAPKTLGAVRGFLDEKTRALVVHASADDLLSMSDAAIAAKLARDWFVSEQQPFAP